MRSTKFKERGKIMEQIIRYVHMAESHLLGNAIQKITSEMNRKGFTLTALSCTAAAAYEKHNAYLVFTKE